MAGPTAHHRPEKDARAKKVVPFLNRAPFWICAAALGALLVCTGARFAVETLAQLQERFDREPDGVKRAKILQKLGDAQFDAERSAAKSGDYSSVGLMMEKYRDNVRVAVETLKKTHADAERHSSGYKQLEMHVGKGLREVHDVILSVPEDYRPPMLLVEQDLKDLDLELLRLLFPRRPGEQPPPHSAASTLKKPGVAPEKQL